MKNELDRQLKEQWEAARLSELNLHIDTEALWQKIARPEKQRKFTVSRIKYAAAMLLGAMVTFGLMQWNSRPGTMALQAGMNHQKANRPVISVQSATALQNETTGDIPVKQQPAPTYVHYASGKASLPPPKAGTISTKQTLREDNPVPENINPVPAEQEQIVVAQTTKPQGRKTIHLLDLEKPAPSSPKPSKLMMAIEEHTRPKSNDIAFSTRILTKQF